MFWCTPLRWAWGPGWPARCCPVALYLNTTKFWKESFNFADFHLRTHLRKFFVTWWVFCNWWFRFLEKPKKVILLMVVPQSWEREGGSVLRETISQIQVTCTVTPYNWHFHTPYSSLLSQLITKTFQWKRFVWNTAHCYFSH